MVHHFDVKPKYYLRTKIPKSFFSVLKTVFSYSMCVSSCSIFALAFFKNVCLNLCLFCCLWILTHYPNIFCCKPYNFSFNCFHVVLSQISWTYLCEPTARLCSVLLSYVLSSGNTTLLLWLYMKPNVNESFHFLFLFQHCCKYTRACGDHKF